MLSYEALQSFKKIYADEFGKEISDQEAMELAASLLTLFDHVYRPVKKEWLRGSQRENEKLDPETKK